MHLISNVSFELAGMPGRDFFPYARRAGTTILRSPPTLMPSRPMSQPLMTSPAPSLKEKGLPDLLLSKTLPSSSLPIYLGVLLAWGPLGSQVAGQIYLISNLLPFFAAGPAPALRSSIVTPLTSRIEEDLLLETAVVFSAGLLSPFGVGPLTRFLSN